MSKKFIVQVAPIIPLPVMRTQVFSYWHEKELPAGTLVSVPFYFREIRGVVVDSKKTSKAQESLKLKNIKSVVEENFLSSRQIELAQKIAEYYFSPLGSVLKSFIPSATGKMKKEKIKKLNFLATAKKFSSGGKSKNREMISKIFEGQKNKFLLIGDAAEKYKTNLDLIRIYLKKKRQVLLLVPEVFSAESLFEKMQNDFPEEIALIHGRITKGQYYDCWRKIKKGEIKIVIATKIGVFLPFFDLGLVIVQEEQDISFKQAEAMPRYNAVRAAEWLAEISGAKLVLEGSVPSVENWWRAQNGELELLCHCEDPDESRGTKQSRAMQGNTGLLRCARNDNSILEIISPERKKISPDFPISRELHGLLADTIAAKKQAVLFVNRRGFSTRTICESCKKVLKCPKCEKPLVYSDEAGLYKCLHCAHKRDLLSACPACGGFQFSHRGVGTQTIEKKIKKLFPSARVARLDADAMRSSAEYKKILRDFSGKKIDILVGTQSAIKGICSDSVQLAAAISGRDFADGTEFNSRHEALARLFHMADLPAENGIMAVQAFSGGNPLFEIRGSRGLKEYFGKELKMRKRFSYPPFRKFVKIGFRDKSEKKVQNETEKMFDLLRKTGNNEIEIVWPYGPLAERKKGMYQRNILLKVPTEKDIRDLPIRAALGGLRKGWSVDVDPVNLF